MPQVVEMTGRRYARLTVLDRAGVTADRAITWNALCDCGQQTVVRGTQLRSGKTRSCGCLSRELAAERRFIDLSGQLFGRLTVISLTGVRKSRAHWNCRCACGVEKVVDSNSLRSGKVLSCGCFHQELRTALKKDVVDYHGAHCRVRSVRGPASSHRCVDCGSTAKDWSYDGADPNELIKDGSSLRYSLSVDHYQARCRLCHSRYDGRSTRGSL